jgi:hypothetical protein
MYATGPNPFQDLKWPTKPCCQLGATSQFQGTPISFHFQENMVTHFEFFMGSVTISVTFLPILGSFQIMFDFDHLILHLFE